MLPAKREGAPPPTPDPGLRLLRGHCRLSRLVEGSGRVPGEEGGLWATPLGVDPWYSAPLTSVLT